MFGTGHNTGAKAYATVGIETGVVVATPHKLIAMLFDGAKLAIDRAFIYTQQNDIAAKGRSISHAISIINDGLRASLNKEVGGEIALSLDALYEYMANRLFEANLNNDLAMLTEVNDLIVELREAWMAIDTVHNTALVDNQATRIESPDTSYLRA